MVKIGTVIALIARILFVFMLLMLMPLSLLLLSILLLSRNYLKGLVTIRSTIYEMLLLLFSFCCCGMIAVYPRNLPVMFAQNRVNNS